MKPVKFMVEKQDDGLYLVDQDGLQVAKMLGAGLYATPEQQAELAEMFAAMPEIMRLAAAFQFLHDLLDQHHRRVVVGSQPPTIVGAKPKPIVGFQWTFVSTASSSFKDAVLAAYDEFQRQLTTPPPANVREIFPGPRKA